MAKPQQVARPAVTDAPIVYLDSVRSRAEPHLNQPPLANRKLRNLVILANVVAWLGIALLVRAIFF